MKRKERFPAGVSPPPANSDQTAMAIDRLETEAQTHDFPGDDHENRTSGEKENEGRNKNKRASRRVVVPVPPRKEAVKKAVGVWIDHRKAVIAVISEEKEETRVIRSNVEKQPGRLAGVRSTTPYESQQVSADDSHQRQFTGHLNSYYDEVIECVRGAEAVLIFGPGEAKGELKKRIERDKTSGRIVAVETVDKMTDRQIAANVREYFKEWSTANRGTSQG